MSKKQHKQEGNGDENTIEKDDVQGQDETKVPGQGVVDTSEDMPDEEKLPDDEGPQTVE